MIESDEEKLVIRRILGDGRRRYDVASKARVVAASLKPGVSVGRLALDNGVNANLVRKWIIPRHECIEVAAGPPLAMRSSVWVSQACLLSYGSRFAH